MAGNYFTANELRKIFNKTRQTINLWITDDEELFPNASQLNADKLRSPYIIPVDDVAKAVEIKAGELEDEARRMRETFAEMAKM